MLRGHHSMNDIFSEKNREEFEEMAKINEYLDEAYRTLIELNMDDEKRLEYEAREKAQKCFNPKYQKEEFEEMTKTSECLDEAYRMLIELSEDDRKRLEYDVHEKERMDYHSQMKDAEKRGIKIGEERTKNVLRLYIRGKTKEELARIFGISVPEIEEILE